MLRDALLDTARRVVDARRVVKYQQEIGVLAVLWYHALTTGAGAQTLGEEYCDIYQVNARGEFPGAARRWQGCPMSNLVRKVYKHHSSHASKPRPPPSLDFVVVCFISLVSLATTL